MPYVRGTEKLEVQLEQANLASFAYPGRSTCYVTFNKWGLGDEVPNMVCYTLAPGVKHFRPPARALSQTHKSPCVAVLAIPVLLLRKLYRLLTYLRLITLTLPYYNLACLSKCSGLTPKMGTYL